MLDTGYSNHLMVYINLTGKKGILRCSSNPPKPESDFFRSLHVGIRGIGKYLICEGFIRVAQRLVLCNHATLGKGTLPSYLSLSAPTHPFRVLSIFACGKYLGESFVCKTMVVLLRDVTLRGVCSGNLPDSLVPGAI